MSSIKTVVRLCSVLVTLAAGTILPACGTSHADGPVTLGTEPGPWCGANGTWRLVMELGTGPIEYDIPIRDRVFSCIDESCDCRWYASTESCAYVFEQVCASPDIRRTDSCEFVVTSDEHMEGTCLQTVESGDAVNEYPGSGYADLL